MKRWGVSKHGESPGEFALRIYLLKIIEPEVRLPNHDDQRYDWTLEPILNPHLDASLPSSEFDRAELAGRLLPEAEDFDECPAWWGCESLELPGRPQVGASLDRATRRAG